MASSHLLSFSFTSLLLILSRLTSADQLLLTVVNNCPFTIWPAVAPNRGYPILQQGGFELQTLAQRSFYAPNLPWSGRIWGRTQCSFSNSKFTCNTGDCHSNLIECNGNTGTNPATLAQLNLHGANDSTSYSVSLVDGFNLPMTITPHNGQGTCPVIGCATDLLPTCPGILQIRCPEVNGPVIGCMSGCEKYGTDELCCKGHYANQTTCIENSYSMWFKQACPATLTYAFDNGAEVSHDCFSPTELKVIFCP